MTITLNKTKTIIRIEHDVLVFNPREESPVTSIYAEHKRYKLNDDNIPAYNNCESWQDVYKNIIKDYKPVIIYPLYMLDHSCLHLSTNDFHDNWDSGQIGYIFITRESMRNNYDLKKLTKKNKQLLINAIQSELKTYNQYLNGEVYCLCKYTLYEDNAGHKLEDFEDSIGNLYLESRENIKTFIKDYFGLNPDEYELKENY